MAKKPSPPPPASPDSEPTPEAPASQPSQETPAPQLTKAVSLDAALAGEPTMPDVQDHAVQAARQRIEEEKSPAAPSQPGTPVKGQTDERGRAFDPAIHDTGPDGKGIVGKKTGYLKMRRGGAALPGAKQHNSKVKLPNPAESLGKTLDASRAAAALKEQIASTAAVTVEMLVLVGQMVGGPEFAPEAGEKDGLLGAFVQYYTVRGVVDIPPEMVVAVAVVGYVGKRWNKPQFTERRASWLRKMSGQPEPKTVEGEVRA